MADAEPPQTTVSRRDPEEMRARFARWLDAKLPDRGVSVSELSAPQGNGMSSETLLVDAEWADDDGQRRPHRLVARVEPDADDVPVFPLYDFELQFRAITLVSERSDVPVPTPHWLELDADVLGGAFFVMDRVEGRVPPDVMPYTFEGWLFDATPDERRALQDRSVEVLAKIHAIPLDDDDRATFTPDAPGDTALRRHVNHWRDYYDWMRGDLRYPIIEQALVWVEDHWPDDEGEAVLSWGDARIGNTIYDGFTPAAVLDWEMVGLGPRGLDVGWMVFLHRFFQDVTEELELAGLPEMFVPSEVEATYRAASGHELRDLRFYEVWAAVRHAMVMARVNQRMVHFGEAEAPGTPDEAVMHRVRLAEMISTPPR